MDNFRHNCPPRMEDGRFLSDWRPANTREQFNKAMNGFTNDNEFRVFMQQNGEKIMDNEWNTMRKTQSCVTKTCIHSLPTTPVPGSGIKELKLYDAVRGHKLLKSDPKYPKCVVMPDYRATHTNNVKY